MRTLRERFDAKWREDPETGCWVWTATRTNPYRGEGYGRISNGNRLVVAHRLAWELYHGPIPEGTCVLHRCDNPPCVNPDHLYLGTQAENIADMMAKGRFVPPPGMTSERAPRGEASPVAKLTEAAVLAIRGSDESSSELGRRYGVTPTAIGHVRRRKTWKHVP